MIVFIKDNFGHDKRFKTTRGWIHYCDSVIEVSQSFLKKRMKYVIKQKNYITILLHIQIL